MKKTRIGTRIVMILLIMVTAFIPVASYAAGAITLSLNDQSMATDTAPVIKDARTLVPIRVITENLNCDVTWDAATKTVTITEKSGSMLKLVIGSTEGSKIAADGTITEFSMDVPASIINGRTMVPIRAISENLSSAPQIGWSNTLRKVCIYTPDYLSEKGIKDISIYVASLKAPIAEASGVTSLGTWNIAINAFQNKPVTLIQVNGVKYIAVSELLNRVCTVNYDPNSTLYKITVDEVNGHAHAENIDNHINTHENYTEDYTACSIYDFYAGSPTVTGMMGTYSVYASTSESGKEELAPIRQYYSDVKTEDTSDGFTADTRKETKHVYNNPAILYNHMIWVPFEDCMHKGPQMVNADCTIAYKNNVAYVMTDDYMKETGKTKASIEGSKENSNTPTKPAQTDQIVVGDTVYATAVFFKCWGTVQQVNGSKAQVQWVQVTDMYGMLVKDYSNEMDIYSQKSMSIKGIMMGSATWVNLTDLNKK